MLWTYTRRGNIINVATDEVVKKYDPRFPGLAEDIAYMDEVFNGGGDADPPDA